MNGPDIPQQHQLVGDEGCTTLPTPFCLSAKGQMCSGSVRQLNRVLFNLANTSVVSGKHQITLRVRHITGTKNVLADALSRIDKPIPSESSLNRKVFLALTEVLGEPAIDLFVTRQNAQTLVFVSPVPDQQAYAIDGLSMDWTNQPLAYVFPPASAPEVFHYHTWKLESCLSLRVAFLRTQPREWQIPESFDQSSLRRQMERILFLV